MLNYILLFTQLLNFSIKGTVTDIKDSIPVENAQVILVEENRNTVTNDKGYFEFSNLSAGTYTVKINAPGYSPSQQTILISDNDISLNLTLAPIEKVSEEIVVTAIRANSQTPVTQYNMSQKDIKAKYFGHDIPALLNNAPSMNTYSETGNGIGYSYMRLRGIDQTRINLTINGIPVNDPETQGYYFNNFADLATSLKSIQIQRGVGTSTNGSASFGGAVNMVSTDLAAKPSFSFSSGYGSFVSRRLAGEFQTGLLQNKFAFYGRISNVGTDGYRDHSAANITSYLVSGIYYGKKSLLKINSFGGMAHSSLAYNATDKSILDTNRTYNPLGLGNKDQFQQTFHQIQYTYEFNKKLNFVTSGYFVKGDGFFDLMFNNYPYKSLNMPNLSPTDTTTNVIASYKLNQSFYGLMSFLNYTTHKMKLNFGVHGNMFQSKHYMQVKWAQDLPPGIGLNYEAYSNTGYKQELSAFAKIQYDVTQKLLLFGDAQVRTVAFQYKAQDKAIFRDTFKVDKMNWLFFNPKVGARYNVTKKTSFYLSGGKTTREPTRIDYMGDDRANYDIKQSDVKPETIYNLELGNEIHSNKVKLNTNIYFMEFRNEIAATGALNYFGYAIRKNVPQSFRRGIEFDWMWQINKFFAVTNTSAFSYNRIKTYTADFEIYDSNGADTYTTKTVITKNAIPILTPSVTLNQGIRLTPLSWLSLDVIGKYVSRMYLDNTNNKTLSTPSFFFADLRLGIKLNSLFKGGDHSLSFQLNNFTNTKYYNSGTPNNFFNQSGSGALTRVVYPSYYPAATRNFFLTLNMKF
ncbi:MAG TPA: TonB-dependent receptor [Cytophagaceae bacterium]|jgi:iron complex outermembrane receptor protein|nr:TonB-dependent receptor [Cytophagaceae bacterium]